jgi:hypothetical protein
MLLLLLLLVLFAAAARDCIAIILSISSIASGFLCTTI